MELMEAIYNRRSVRAYTDQPVDKVTVNKLLQAAVQAPSAMNMQPWAFVVIQGTDVLEQFSARVKAYLLEIEDTHSPLYKYREILLNPDFKISNIFYRANTLIAICSKPTGPHAAEDCCLAAQNLMLAACALGLGTCPIGLARPWMNQPEVKQELGIPPEYTPVFPLVVGVPQGEMSPVPRNEPEIVSWM
ncbi:MAG: nitroreductase [Xenococcaceae cyanobacterium MO_188.B32]|nr:nitroreductase [Xenococcaceae cyanobacterium MO_188.B32]